MLKVFRLEPDNPLAWKLSFNDAEIDKIIANRYIDAFSLDKKTIAKKRVKEKYAIHRLKLTVDSVWYFCC